MSGGIKSEDVRKWRLSAESEDSVTPAVTFKRRRIKSEAESEVPQASTADNTPESAKWSESKGFQQRVIPVNEVSDPWQDWHTDISSALSYARKKEMYVDVAFWRDNLPCLFAHKLVLSLWSPEFADFAKQKQSQVKLKFTEDVDVMEAVLEYLYSMPGSDPFYTRLPVKKLIQVLDITERLCIRQLHKKCMNSLQRKKIVPTNVIAILDYGLRKDVECIVKKCMKVLATQGVSESSLSSTVSLDAVRAMLQLDKIFLESEAALLRLALSWLSCPQNVRYKYEVLSLLDFSSIECNEFQDVWRKFPGIFTGEERSSILLAVSQKDESLFPGWYRPKVSSIVEWNCSLCMSARIRLTVPYLLKFPRWTSDDQTDISQAFNLTFEDHHASKLETVELNIGPMDIPESELTVKFNRQQGQWRECRLDYVKKMNRYMLHFHNPLKLNTRDVIQLKFTFPRSLKRNKIRYSKPNIIEKEKINRALYDGSVKIELKSSNLAFYCGSLNDPKFLVAAFYFRWCDNHTAYLVRKPIKPKLNEFRNLQLDCIVPETEIPSKSMIKIEEICID